MNAAHHAVLGRRSSPRIIDLLQRGRCFSFEFLPPRTDGAEAQLEPTLAELAPLHPSFVSVTYGAGGTTRARARDIVVDLLHTTTTPPMAHLTCAGHTEAELRDVLEAVADDPAEVRRIGIETATELCRGLLDAGAPGLHFYTLNRARATKEIFAMLDLDLPKTTPLSAA